MTIRVLVTGAGSGVGQGILKALRASDLRPTVISADISPLNSALYRADEAILIPRVEEPGALERFITLLNAHKIDVVMVGSEFDLLFFAQYKRDLEEATGALIAVSPLPSIEISDDKWLTTCFLAENGLPHARAALPANVAEARAAAEGFGLPVVLKSRTGTSSRNVHVIRSLDQIDAVFDGVANPMLQEFAGDMGDGLGPEYTCSVFACADGTLLGPFTARRTLRGGSSWVVEVGTYSQLYPTLLNIARKLPMAGSINVQLRDGPKGPIPFEFNVRFSGTTAVRAHFGFNEPDMFLRSYLLGEKVEQPQIRSGVAFRYLEEVFIENVSASDLVEPFPKGVVRPWF